MSTPSPPSPLSPPSPPPPHSPLLLTALLALSTPPNTLPSITTLPPIPPSHIPITLPIPPTPHAASLQTHLRHLVQALKTSSRPTALRALHPLLHLPLVRPTILALNALPSLLRHPDGLLPSIPATLDPLFPSAFAFVSPENLVILLESSHPSALQFLAAALPTLPPSIIAPFRTSHTLAALRHVIPHHPSTALPIATALIQPAPSAAITLLHHNPHHFHLLSHLAPLLSTHPHQTLSLLLASCASTDVILPISHTTPLLRALLTVPFPPHHAPLLCRLLVLLSPVYQVFHNLLTHGLTPCLIRLLRATPHIPAINLLTRAIASPTQPPQPPLALQSALPELLSNLLHTHRHDPTIIHPVITALITLLDAFPPSRTAICQASAPEAVHYALTEHAHHAPIVAASCNFLLRLTPRQLADAQLTAPALIRLLSSRGKQHPSGPASLAVRELRSAVEAMDDDDALTRASRRTASGSFRMSFHKTTRIRNVRNGRRRARSDFGLDLVRERVSRKLSVPVGEGYDQPMSLGRLRDDVGRLAWPRTTVVERRGGIGKEAFVAPLREDILPTPITSFDGVDSFQTRRDDSFSMSDSTSSLNGALDATEGNMESAGDVLAPAVSMEHLGKESCSPCTNGSESEEADFPDEFAEERLKGKRFGERERERSGVSSRGSWGRPQWSIWAEDNGSSGEPKSFARVHLRGESGTLKVRQ